jgi:hypothetical protein
LEADRVVLLLAGRDSVELPELSGVEELRLDGLGAADARALLTTVLPGRIDSEVVERIIVETGGNPLALVELPRGLSPGELAGGFGLLERLGLSGRIQESSRRRLEELGPDTRLLLLVAAVEEAGDVVLLRRACERLGIAPGGGGCGRKCGSDPDRSACAVLSPAGSFRGLRRSARAGAQAGTRGAWSGDRSGS